MKFEAEIIRWLQSGMNEGWLTLFKIITLFGSWLGFAVALAFIFYRKKSLSYAFAITFLFGTLFNLAIKHIFCRSRPFDKYSFIQNLANESGFSMPSSHATLAAIIAVFFIYCIVKMAISKHLKATLITFVVLFSMLVCLSRMVLGAHYLTDLIAGVCEGVILAVIGIIVYNVIMKKLEKRRNK